MNTLTHILIGTAAARRTAPLTAPLTIGLTLAAFSGAVFPDISILVMVFWEMGGNGTSESELWNEAYYSEPWVTYRMLTNSFFVFGALLVIAWWRGWMLLVAFSISILLHFTGDIFLHYNDGHPHFWPVSACVFYSPVSYWDFNHYGFWWTLIEMALALGVMIYIWRRERGVGIRVYSGVLVALFWAMSLLVLTGVVTFDDTDGDPELFEPYIFVQPACPGSIDVATQPTRIEG